MKNQRFISTSPNDYTRFIHPKTGGCRRALLNILLRVAVKSRHGRHIDIGELRQKFDQLNKQASKLLLESCHREKVDCNGVPGTWLVPTNCRQERVLLYIHGGAFVAHTDDTYAAMASAWCQRLQARALMVDYHLAPEHPYPAAFNDCLTAYQWLLDNGVAAKNIVVAGDSAGGNLALGMLQKLKAQERPQPACAVLLSPFLDFTLTGDSALKNAGHDPIFTLNFAVGIREFYAPGHAFSAPEISPLFGDFSGLPPLLFQVGSTEILLDDSVRAAKRAHDASVTVELEIWDRLPHVFQMVTDLPQAHAAIDRIQSFTRHHAGWNH